MPPMTRSRMHRPTVIEYDMIYEYEHIMLKETEKNT